MYNIEIISNSSKPKVRKAACLILSFAVPYIVVLLASYRLGIYPFGSHSYAISDGKQYITDLVYMGRTLRGEESLLYSFYGGGQNRWAYLAWEGFNPVLLLTWFTSIDTIYSCFTWITQINIALCGLTMYILLAETEGPAFRNLFFSTTYALMGFCAVYCFQYHFFIGPQVLPLMVLGLIQLIEGKKPWLYIISLFICIFLNFYFGFMLCVVSLLIMFGYLYAGNLENRRRVIAHYFSSTVIAGLLAAFMWLPALKAFSGGGRFSQISGETYSLVPEFPFFQMFTKLFTGANSTDELLNGLPNLFCGVFVLALVVLFFAFGETSPRRKIAAGMILLFYLLSFYIPAINALMHGGAIPNGFNYRDSFVFSFLMICIASEQFRQKTNMKHVAMAFLIILGAAALLFSRKYDYITSRDVMIDFILLGLMGILFFAYDKAIIRRQVFAFFLFILVCTNLFGNYYLSVRKMQDYELITEDAQNNNILTGGLVEALQTVDTGLYRMEKDYSKSGIGESGTNDVYYGYYGVNRWGSTTRTNIRKGYARLGFGWVHNLTWYTNTVTSPADTLLGLKYLISARNLAEEKEYEKLVSGIDQSIYKNPYTLSFATLVNERTQKLSLGSSVPENLNAIWQSMTGENREIFMTQEDLRFSYPQEQEWPNIGDNTNKEDAELVYVEYSFTPKKDGIYYIFYNAVPASDDGLSVEASSCFGACKAGEEVSGRMAFSTSVYNSIDQIQSYCSWLEVARVDNELVQEYAALLNNREIDFNMEKAEHLTGSFCAEKGQRILFTLPWDEGWTCYIDGEEVPIDKTWDLFMSVEAPEGHHTYEMKFFPAWMDYGLVISGIALVGLVVFMILWNKKNKKTAAVSAETTNADGLISDTSENTGADKAETGTDAVAERTIEKDRSEAAE